MTFILMWADNQMTSYEKRLEEHMRDMEEGRRADIEKVEKMTMANIDRLEKLIETKHNEQYERLRLELGLHKMPLTSNNAHVDFTSNSSPLK